MEKKINTFNEAEFTKGLLIVTNAVAEVNTYTHWSYGTKEDVLKEGCVRFYNYIEKHAGIDFNNMTPDVAERLGMMHWENGLWLFPLWMLPIIPEGLEVETINGHKFKFDIKTSNNDIRYGCVGYGIRIKEND